MLQDNIVVDIWYLFTKTLDDLPKLSFLDKNELSIYETIKCLKTKKTFLLSRYMQRTVLAQYIEMGRSEKIEIQRNQFGKPFVCASDINFNVTHTDNLIVLAVSKTNFLGIDVEYRNCHPELYTILSISEQIMLDRIKDHKKKEIKLLEFWVKKEAYLKAVGLGLVDDLHNVDVSTNKVKYHEYPELFTKKIFFDHYFLYYCCEIRYPRYFLKNFQHLI